jgi:virginiamycin B lyase
MTVDDRLRRATTALDRSVQEVDVVQRLGQLKGRQRRQARAAIVVAAVVLVVAVGALVVGLAVARQREDVVRPAPRPLGKVVGTVPLPAGEPPWGVAFAEGDVWALINTSSSASGGTVARIDPKTNRVVATIPVGQNPGRGVGGAGAVWVVNYGGSTVSRIDPATNKLVATIKLGAQAPSGLGIADGAVWVTAASDKAVFRIDPATNAVVGRIGVRGGNVSLATGAGAVWVQSLDGNLITRIDPNR